MNDTTIPRLPALWDHQQDAVAGAISNLATDDRCKVTMACATGKTRVGPSIVIARGARTVIIYLPSLALIRQTLPEWIAAPFPAPLRYLCVCSDSTVADQSDEVVVTEDDIEREFGRSVVTTRSEVVQEFLADDADTVSVVFSTYQSSDVVRDGLPDGFTFDMGFFDEAHRTAGRDGMFSAPLHDAHTPMAKRVFMTATPKHLSYRGRKAGAEAAVVYSMDDEKLYGRTAYNLPIREAIKLGIIADYKVLISVIDDQRLKRDALKGHIGTDGKPVDAEAMAHAIAIRDAMDQFGVSKVVTFHNSVAEAEDFATHPAIAAELKTSTYHVNGRQAASLRSEILGQFAEAAEGVVTNARCLTEGVDVPAIDMVAFLHPKKSHIDIIQAIGRALRQNRESGKTHGYILLPLYVPEIGDGGFDRALKEFGYDTIWQVIEALREQDEVVNAAIQEATRARRAGGPTAKLDFLEVTGPSVHLNLLRDSVSTQCIDALGALWDEMYGVLARYKEETGEVNPPIDEIFEGKSIGKWLSHQRSNRKAESLSDERISLLDALGIEWTPLDTQWPTMAEAYARYVEATGKANPPEGTVFEGKKLAKWLSRQRQSRKAGNLSAERITILDRLGIEWTPFNTQWSTMAEAYARYVKETGGANSPNRFEGKNLGAWLIRQRQDRKDGKLSDERISVLDALGIEWTPFNTQWSTMAETYARYVKETGSVNPPTGIVFEGESLGTWLARQRQDRKDGKLSDERISVLDALGIEWSPLDTQWSAMAAVYARYVKETGSVNPPTGIVFEGESLGTWLARQRQDRKDGKLSDERISLLDALGIEWAPLDTQWSTMAEAYARYVKETGSVNPPEGTVFEGKKLDAWVLNQRSAHKAGKLSTERIAVLNGIGIKWNPLDTKWATMTDVYARYVEATGETNPPIKTVFEGKKLGVWLSNKRRSRKAGKLSAERIAILDGLGIRWSFKDADTQGQDADDAPDEDLAPARQRMRG